VQSTCNSRRGVYLHEMHAEIIAVGDEITSGQLLDSNSQWLSLRLEEMGIRVLHHSTVGDELEPAAEVFRQAIRRSDVVMITGGLGPTADDHSPHHRDRAHRRSMLHGHGTDNRHHPRVPRHARLRP